MLLTSLRYLPGKQGCLKYRTKGLRLVVGYRDGWMNCIRLALVDTIHYLYEVLSDFDFRLRTHINVYHVVHILIQSYLV